MKRKLQTVNITETILEKKKKKKRASITSGKIPFAISSQSKEEVRGIFEKTMS